MLKKIMEYLNTTKRHPGNFFMKFERDECSCQISFVCVLLGFSLNPYYELLAWFMIKSKKYKYNLVAHAKIPMKLLLCCDRTMGPLGLGGPRQLAT